MGLTEYTLGPGLTLNYNRFKAEVDTLPVIAEPAGNTYWQGGDALALRYCCSSRLRCEEDSNGDVLFSARGDVEAVLRILDRHFGLRIGPEHERFVDPGPVIEVYPIMGQATITSGFVNRDFRSGEIWIYEPDLLPLLAVGSPFAMGPPTGALLEGYTVSFLMREAGRLGIRFPYLGSDLLPIAKGWRIATPFPWDSGRIRRPRRR